MGRRALTLVLLFCASCAGPDTFSELEQNCPPPEYGRPGWVRACAKVGAFAGAVPGVILTVLALPITYPLTLIADEPLGKSKKELLFFPLTTCASAGHFILGAPPDSLHWIFYRAWTERPIPDRFY